MTDVKRPVPIGRFRLFKSLKKGGMARVFLGIDPDAPEQLYAVKTLLPKLSGERMYREMFASEGKVGVRLNHPNIVHTADYGDSNGTPFIAMHFIFGFDLSSVLRRLRKRGDRMPARLAVTLARDMAVALHHAHRLTDEFGQPLSIVNRDVSPGNIMIGFDGRPKLIDFGIAQTTIDVQTQIGSIKGKISYMSPEQVRGLPVDHRTDIFSLGTVLYEMLTMVQVFHGEGDFETMDKVRRAEAEPPSAHEPGVDPALDRVVMWALARDAEQRPQSAEALRVALDEWLAGHGGPAEPEDLARFMVAAFGKYVDDMRGDIEASRRAALAGEATIADDELPEQAVRLIPEEALEERARTPAAAPARRDHSWILVWGAIIAVVAAGVAWVALR